MSWRKLACTYQNYVNRIWSVKYSNASDVCALEISVIFNVIILVHFEIYEMLTYNTYDKSKN